MPGKAAKTIITERQQEILQTLSRSVTAPSHFRQRASIIVLAFDGLRNQDIAARVGLTQRQVGLWRRRWANAWEKLIDIECCESRAALRRAIEAVLTDAPRPGAPGKFTPEQVTLILAVACEPPEKSGRPITHWTVQELTDEVIGRGIVGSILGIAGLPLPPRGGLAASQEPLLVEHHREGSEGLRPASRGRL
jgi:putative transposase